MQPIDYYDEKFGRLSHERALEDREKKALYGIRKLDVSGRCLDIGCGDGFFLRHLKNVDGKFSEYYGLDYSEYQIEMAKNDPRNANFNFSRCNVEDGIDYPASYFDLIYCGEVIEHLYNPDKLLQECGRILTPDGFLVLTTPNLLAWYNRFLAVIGIQPIFYEASAISAKTGFGFLKKLKKDDVPVGHIRLLTQRALLDLLNDSGLRIHTLTGCVFEGFPKPMKLLDKFFCVAPGLASGFVVIAKK